MYLSELKIWNFRKYTCNGDNFEKDAPGLAVTLNPGLNVLIGENDSGKTAIVDAIRLMLGTQSREWARIDKVNFAGEGTARTKKLQIEAIFQGFSIEEAAPFLEWIGKETIEEKTEYVLPVRLTAIRKGDRIIQDFRAGMDPVGSPMDGEARDLLRVTYLKPLRDAENELTPGRRSRLAQILSAHKLFTESSEDGEPAPHTLETIVKNANDAIKEYFSLEDDEAEGREVTYVINEFLKEFLPEGSELTAEMNISGSALADILRCLELMLEENQVGLGSLNLLYIATELLLLQSVDYQGLKLAIVEELEAHLHPQAQLRLIKCLESKAEQNGQFILTTHSTTLGASIDLTNLIICKDDKAFPMGPGFTKMDPADYDFLHRFLETTKANLFFARGVILVEGDAENLLVPAIADLIGRPLHRYGVSIVNVGSTAFLHYARIFQRKDGQYMGIPVAVITDMDVKPEEWEKDDGSFPTAAEVSAARQKRLEWAKKTFKEGQTKAFVSPNWTLEYEVALEEPLRKSLYVRILYAEKIENAKTGQPKDSKLDEVQERAKSDLETWEKELGDNERICEKIAYRIYKETLLDNRISKAIVAQLMAKGIAGISDRERCASLFLKSKNLRYIVDAILHVTKPLEDSQNAGSD